MDYKSIFSAISLFSVIIYMYIGLYTFKRNVKSLINKVFLLLCISYSIWSFAYAFAYAANDSSIFMIWNKISALGWCTFSSISLYLVLLITDNKSAQNNIVKVLIFSPAIIFLYMAIFLFQDGIVPSQIIINIFYVGDFLYNFTFLLISIILIFLWGLRTKSKRKKIQSKILVVSSIIPFGLNLLTQTILPLIGYNEFPLMGQLYSVIMILGTYIVIIKYKFLKIPEKIVLEEVESKILDMIIILNEKGELIKISKNTLNMLEYKEDELLNENITMLFNSIHKEKFRLSNLMQGEVNYNDIEIIKKNGQSVPINAYCVAIWDKKINDFLGVVIVMQDITIEHELRRKNCELQEKTIRDGLTKLYNHQYAFDKIEEEIEEAVKEGNKKKISLIMTDIDYFKKVNDTYGHLFGDYVLKTISDILVKIVDNSGYVGRFGGEEFIIVLPEISLKEALEIGEKIRSAIESYEFDENLRVTVSVGIKERENESAIELIKKADNLLYKAKQSGRNRVEYI